MDFQLSAHRTLGQDIPLLAVNLLDQALGDLTQRQEDGPVGPIPAALTSLERLRSLLELAGPVTGPEFSKRETAAIRAAVHPLSTVWDAQACVTTFEQLMAIAGLPRLSEEAADQVRADLALDLETVQQMTAAASHLPPVIADLRAARERLAHWNLDGNAWSLIGKGLKATYRRGRQALGCSRGRKADEAAWNEAREQASALAGQLHLLQPIWPGPLAALLVDLDTMLGQLQAHYDLTKLHARLLDHLERSPNGLDLDALEAPLNGRRDALREQIYSGSRRIFAERPICFEERIKAYWKAWVKDAGSKLIETRMG